MNMEEIIDQTVKIPEKTQDIRQIPALTLAYLGDAIYELVIRTTLVENGMSHVDSLNRRASGYAKAPTQAKIYHMIEPDLSEEELGYYKRGRNAKSGSVAKSGTVAEYRIATGFEAMMGYLYLTGQMDRILELVKKGIDSLQG
jgi:ribonuclease-3 family protein